ncbi:MAG: hypothetical protein U5K51_13225 [Flavobacteriaceae bacterium]|nr:hypothetical protein [Flavobacteriaceae bacterium]
MTNTEAMKQHTNGILDAYKPETAHFDEIFNELQRGKSALP